MVFKAYMADTTCPVTSQRRPSVASRNMEALLLLNINSRTLTVIKKKKSAHRDHCGLWWSGDLVQRLLGKYET